jgi:hypothetical protein
MIAILLAIILHTTTPNTPTNCTTQHTCQTGSTLPTNAAPAPTEAIGPGHWECTTYDPAKCSALPVEGSHAYPQSGWAWLADIHGTGSTEDYGYDPAQQAWLANRGQNPGAGIQEDDPRWNCLTMGNHLCGQGAELPSENRADGADETGHWLCDSAVCSPEGGVWRWVVESSN